MNRVRANPEVCIGCRLCQVHCQVEHSQSRTILRAFKKEQPPLPRVVVYDGDDFHLAVQCQHCAEPRCVYSCLTGALYRDPSGAVYVNAEKCVGCWTCVICCPFGAIAPDSARNTIVKCDLCPDLTVPACVANCPNRALTLVEYTHQPDHERSAIAVGAV